MPEDEISKLFRQQKYCLRTTYLMLDTYIRTWNSIPEKPWKMLNDQAVPKTYAHPRHQQSLTNTINSSANPFKKLVLEELAKCWKLRVQRDQATKGQNPGINSEVQVISDEQERGSGPSDGGQEIVECQCCFTESPLSGMVHCEGATIHVST